MKSDDVDKEVRRLLQEVRQGQRSEESMLFDARQMVKKGQLSHYDVEAMASLARMPGPLPGELTVGNLLDWKSLIDAETEDITARHADPGTASAGFTNLRERYGSPVAQWIRALYSVYECLAYLHDTTGRTRVDICEAAGLHDSNYSLYVTGKGIPGHGTLTKILDAFAETLPELREGAPAREHILRLRALQRRRIPESYDTADRKTVEALLRAFERIDEQR